MCIYISCIYIYHACHQTDALRPVVQIVVQPCHSDPILRPCETRIPIMEHDSGMVPGQSMIVNPRSMTLGCLDQDDTWSRVHGIASPLCPWQGRSVKVHQEAFRVRSDDINMESALWDWADPVGVGLSLWPLSPGPAAKKDLAVVLLQHEEKEKKKNYTPHVSRDGLHRHHPVVKVKVVQPSNSIPTSTPPPDVERSICAPDSKTVDLLPASGASTTATTKGTLFLPAESESSSQKEKGDAFVCPPSYAAINPDTAKLETVLPTPGAEWPKYGFGQISQSRMDTSAVRSPLESDTGRILAHPEKKRKRNARGVFIVGHIPTSSGTSKGPTQVAEEDDGCDRIIGEGLNLAIQNCFVEWRSHGRQKKVHSAWQISEDMKTKFNCEKQNAQKATTPLSPDELHKSLQQLTPVIDAFTLSLSCKKSTKRHGSRWRQMSFADLIEWRGGQDVQHNDAEHKPLKEPNSIVCSLLSSSFFPSTFFVRGGGGGGT
jgi:hypothetical protein